MQYNDNHNNHHHHHHHPLHHHQHPHHHQHHRQHHRPRRLHYPIRSYRIRSDHITSYQKKSNSNNNAVIVIPIIGIYYYNLLILSPLRATPSTPPEGLHYSALGYLRHVTCCNSWSLPPQLSHDVATLTKKRYLTKSNATMPSKQRSYSVALLFFRRLNLVVLDLDWWHSFCLFCHLLCIFSTFGIYISIPNCTPNSFAYQITISMHISNHQTKQKN